MLILEISGLKKYFGDRLLLDIPRLMIYDSDKIGLVGENGVGKTTLMEILHGSQEPDEGNIKKYGGICYIPQFGEKDYAPDYLSGGEKTRLKIDDAFATQSHLLLADEPTTNLDIENIEKLQKQLMAYQSGIILISHDRRLLNRVCNKIIEISDGSIKEYTGNYDNYRQQKEADAKRLQFEYDQYKEEKRRLTAAIQTEKQKAASMTGPPKRMGNSEARLHKRADAGRAQINKAVKRIESRLDLLEEVSGPRRKQGIKLDVLGSTRLTSAISLDLQNINISFDGRTLINNSSFSIKTNSKTALIGANGSGKSSLLRLIQSANNTDGGNGYDSRVRIAPSAKIAYFAQDLSMLDESKSIFENVGEGSSLSPSEIRTILARLQFRGDAVFKPVSVLSGGEKVKASLAKIFSAGVNMLILDEPTNYLDLFAAEALEELMTSYSGTILFVSHDRELIEKTADHLLILQNGNITAFDGTWADYQEHIAKPAKDSNSDSLLQLEHRMAFVTGRLSSPKKSDDIDALDKEFFELAAKIRSMRS